MITDVREAPPQTAAPSVVNDWLRLARMASIAMVVWSAVLQVLAGTVIPPVAVIGVVFLAFAAGLTGERRRLGLGVAIFSGLAVLGNLPVIADELQNPDSAPAFILNLFSLSAVVVAATAGVSAYRRRSTAPIRSVAAVAVGVFVAGTVISLLAAAASGSEAALPTDVTVVARHVAWDPDAIVVPADASGVWVDNLDGIRHTFTVPALGIDVEVPAWRARRIALDAPPGTYEVICLVPTHSAMTANITIGD